jgi:hypothetical protein
MQGAWANLLSVTYPALQYLRTLSYKRHDFREKKVIGHTICVSIFSTTLVLNISHSKKN